MKRIVRIIIPVLILLGSWFGYEGLSVKEPPMARPIPKKRLIQTQVKTLTRGDFQIEIKTQGLVRAHHQATLMGQISGRVMDISENLHDGSFFNQGDVLVHVERVDLEADLTGAAADLARAKAQHSLEEAKAKQAKLNWKDLGYEEEPNELVLRLPQLREAEANVNAAQAGLDRAKRDLDRTEIRAPFAGRVLTRSISVGQQITPNTPLAEIFSTDFVEIRLPISAAHQGYLPLPESTAQPALPVTLTNALDQSARMVWKGEIVGSEGQLDPESRELFTIGRIYDPFGLKSATPVSPLRIGQPLTAIIQGKVLENVMVIPRVAVTKLNQVYLIDPETLILNRHAFDAIWTDENFIIISDETIPDGTLLATTRLAYAPDGSTVEILPDEEPNLTDTKPKTPPTEGSCLYR